MVQTKKGDLKIIHKELSRVTSWFLRFTKFNLIGLARANTVFLEAREMKKLQIDGESLAIEDIIAVARGDIEVAHSEEAIEKVRESRKTLEQFEKDKKIIYGITTGVRI